MPSSAQTAILANIPQNAAYLYFTLHTPAQLQQTLLTLGQFCIQHHALLAIGRTLIKNPDLNNKLRPRGFKNHPVPQQETDLLIWLRGADAGEIFLQGNVVQQLAQPAFTLTTQQTAFCYQHGRDLTGYEDGTENPQAKDASDAALISTGVLQNSSFFVLQRWRHQLAEFKQKPQPEQDNIIGRRLSDNEELDDAPRSAHVKRTAQESFTPEVFMLRKSMPWITEQNAGLMFAAFINNLQNFERMMARMTGDEDGIKDALFSFSELQNSTYCWCPAVVQGKLNFDPVL
jgi:porphyrinogen peroxidase